MGAFGFAMPSAFGCAARMAIARLLNADGLCSFVERGRLSQRPSVLNKCTLLVYLAQNIGLSMVLFKKSVSSNTENLIRKAAYHPSIKLICSTSS